MNDNTTVKTVDIESLDEFFGGVSAEQIVTSQEPPKTVLSGEASVDLDPSKLNTDKPASEATTITPDAGASTTTPVAAAATGDNIPDLSFDQLLEQQQQENTGAGRAKTDKSGIVELYKKRIEAGQMVPFDDFKDGDDLGEYLGKLSMPDMEALWDANVDRQKQELQEKVPQDFFNALPQELQFAAKYVADGGQDLKGLFKALAQVEEIRELDPEKHPREVSYQYLKATNYGDEAEIQEQLDEWEDMGVITKKSQTFKPKLDKMQEQVVEQQLQQAEQQKVQKEQAALKYVENVQTALKEPELAGIKLDKKTHEFLTQGLLQPSYPSITGRNTNLLGHLLEKHQVVEPNYPLVAEALWLLSDPEGYRSKLIERGVTKQNDKVVRELKGEQARRTGSSQNPDQPDTSRSRGVPRPSNILKR